MITTFSAKVRRGLDLLLVATLSPLWILLFALCALAVGATGLPVFFRQDRVGAGGTTFSMIKFRSMRTGPNTLIPDSEAITSVGAFLRRTSLDELPQVINIIRGDMSIVGPRPMLPVQLGKLSPAQAERHSVRPGLTGLAQVNGRNSLRWDQRIAFDCQWSQKPSIFVYFGILFATVSVVLSGTGIGGHSNDDPIATAAEVVS